MKKFLSLTIITLLLSACNNINIDEPDLPLGGGSEDTEHFYITIVNFGSDNLSFAIVEYAYMDEISYNSKIKLTIPIKAESNNYTVAYKDAYDTRKEFIIKNPSSNKHYILTFNAMRNPSFSEDIGGYSLRVTNKTKYQYLVTDPYNNSKYSIDPSTSQTLRNLPCNIDIPIKFETGYDDLDIKKALYYETFNKIRADYTFDYSITKSPTCEDYNLCYIYLTNNASDNFCILDSTGKEILSVAPGKHSFTAHTAGNNKLTIKQKDGYIFYPDEYTFNGSIPKCGSIHFTVTDDNCIQSISY